MKTMALFLLAAVLLTGCARAPVLETVNDVWTEPKEAPAMAQLRVIWPDDAAQTVMAAEDGTQICTGEGYELRLETLAAGDLDRTLKTVTGYDREALTVFSTDRGDCRRYECAWCTQSEEGTQVGRTVVLDDGAYHYVMTALMPEEQAQGKNGAFVTLDLFRLAGPEDSGS